MRKMNQKYLAVLTVLSIITCVVNTASAETCPYDTDYKYALKKALVDYLKDPSESKMQLGEVKQILNFYLVTGSLVDSDCPPQINALVDKADSQISDENLKTLGSRGIDKCNVCPDGALCGEQNAKGQTCTCKDIDNDGRSEYCFLKPVKAPKPTCDVCPDGTVCKEKNQKDQTCTCKDTNSDGIMEYCFLKPLEPESTTTTLPENCQGYGEHDCLKTACCTGMDCKKDLFPDLATTCCNPQECAADNACSYNGRILNDVICLKGEWVNNTCSVPSKKDYICPDGTKIAWCECKNNKQWNCTSSPENNCKTTTTTTPNQTTTTTLPQDCLKHFGKDCSQKACCPGLECKEQPYPNTPKICCLPKECPNGILCMPNGEPSGNTTCMNGQWVNSTCSFPSKKDYICPDGTKIAWCECKDNRQWSCTSSPENNCKTTTTTTISP